MNRVLKELLKVLGIFIIIIFGLILLLFLYSYYNKVKTDLVDYNIQEKLIVKFKNNTNNYLLDLNNGKFSIYKGEYKNYSSDFGGEYKITSNKRIYNQNNTYYFDYRLRVYNQNNTQIYMYPNSVIFESYWSQDGKYIISTNGYINRLFGLFLSIPSVNPVLTIIEPETGKMKQILFDGKIKEVEKILGYVN